MTIGAHGAGFDGATAGRSGGEMQPASQPSEVTLGDNPLEPASPQRRIVNVMWGGASVRDVLEMVDVDLTARYLWSFGADHGAFAGIDVNAYNIDLPLNRAVSGDVLLAYEPNGHPLPAIVNTGVYRVYPGRDRRGVAGHPGSQRGQGPRRPGSDMGQAVVADVVLSATAGDTGPVDLPATLRECLTAYEVP